jgi:tRNA A37 threonylcarbamoyltransferase TsaD
MKYCTDNAAMIASAGYYMYKENMFDDYSLGINPSLDL